MHSWHEKIMLYLKMLVNGRELGIIHSLNENMHSAVNREVKATRDSLGILDASTLGKIDIKGKDVAEFLNRIYTNAWSKLEIGKCRYGLMLGDDGMVIDDGVTTRIDENHYVIRGLVTN